MNRLVTIAAALLAFAPFAAHAQTQTARTYQGQDGQTKEALGTFCVPDAAGGGCAGGGGGGGGAATIANGADVAEGATTDTAYAGSGASTVVSLLKGNYNALIAPTPAGSNNIGAVNLSTAGTALSGGNTSATTIAATGINTLAANAFSRIWNGSTWSPQLADTGGRAIVVPFADSTATSGVAPSASTAVETGRVVKASAGNLFGLNVVTGATAGYVLVFNSTTIPADGAVTPVKCYAIATNTSLDLNLRAAPLYLSSGITVVFSTTGCFTKTASATAFISGDAK